MLVALRPRYVPAFATFATRTSRSTVRVGGTSLGDNFYKDDNGNLWKIELDTSGDTFIDMRGTTDAYGGTTTEWRFTRSAVYSDIDRRASLLAGITSAAESGTAAAGSATATKAAPKPISSSSALSGSPAPEGSTEPGPSSNLGTAIAVGIFVSAIALFLFIG